MNNNLIEYLQKEIDENKISHAFLVERNNCEKLLNELSSLLKENGIILSQSLENNISVSIINPENNLIDKNKILELQKYIMTKSVINKYKVYNLKLESLRNKTSRVVTKSLTKKNFFSCSP